MWNSKGFLYRLRNNGSRDVNGLGSTERRRFTDTGISSVRPLLFTIDWM